MGDSTNMSGFLYSVPKGKAKKVAAVFDDYAVAQDWDTYQRSGAWDAAAVRYIMGHVDDARDMGAVYNEERPSDERLREVTDHVRDWLRNT